MNNAKTKGPKRFLITEHATNRKLVVVEAADDNEAVLRATAVVHLVGAQPGLHLWQVSELAEDEAVTVAHFSDGYFKLPQAKLRPSSRSAH